MYFLQICGTKSSVHLLTNLIVKTINNKKCKVTVISQQECYTDQCSGNYSERVCNYPIALRYHKNTSYLMNSSIVTSLENVNKF